MRATVMEAISLTFAGLQHVLNSQRSRRFVTQGKRIFQELKDLGFGLQVPGTVPTHEVFRELIVGTLE